MKLKVCLGVGALLLSSVAFAQEKQQQMTPEQQAGMDAMMKAASPGEAHRRLANFAGTWDATVKTFMQPGAQPQVSHGTAVNSTVLGGRYLNQMFTGDFMGMPYSGIGYWGYDNMKRQYIATWMDSLSTSVMTLTGTSDSPNLYTLKGMAPDPMSGKDTAFEERWTVADNDHHTFEMWGPAPDGKMFKMMEIAYSRKK